MISIVIPTYNEEKYLPRLLESIKKQSYKDYEIIISDNKSKDNTRKIAKRYGSRIVEGGTPAISRQKGGETAKYDIIFMDADVILPDNFLNNFTKKIKNADLATCWITPLSNKLSHKIFFLLKNLSVIFLKKTYTHTNAQCFYSKKNLFNNVAFKKDLKHGDEHDFVMRAQKKGKYKFITDLFVYNSVRRLESVGTLKLFLITLYPGIVRFFKRDLNKQIVNYEWGKFE